MNKFLSGAAVAAAVAASSVGIAVVNPLGFAGAQETPTTEAPSTEAPANAEAPAGDPGHGPRRGEVMTEVLDGLVADGTITQAQADAIKGRIKEKVESLPKPENGHGPRHHFGAALEEVATALGMTTDEVKAGLEADKTIAQLAQEKGLDVQTVIDSLVASANVKIDEAVAAGNLEADKAAEIKEKLVERITERVNEGRPDDGPGRGRGRGPR